MRPDLANVVVSTIKRNWAKVLHPEAPRNQWEQSLGAIFPDHSVWNWTDFNYDKCHTYEVVLHRGQFPKPGSMEVARGQLRQLGCRLNSVILSLSTVAPFFRMDVQTRVLTADGDVTLKKADEREFPEEIQRIRQFAVQNGFAELPLEVLGVVIPDAELDLTPRGKVTVYNCLFYDEHQMSDLS